MDLDSPSSGTCITLSNLGNWQSDSQGNYLSISCGTSSESAMIYLLNLRVVLPNCIIHNSSQLNLSLAVVD